MLLDTGALIPAGDVTDVSPNFGLFLRPWRIFDDLTNLILFIGVRCGMSSISKCRSDDDLDSLSALSASTIPNEFCNRASHIILLLLIAYGFHEYEGDSGERVLIEERYHKTTQSKDSTDMIFENSQ